MGKISYDDKMRIQTLRETGCGYKTIIAKFPEKKLEIVVCKGHLLTD